MEHLDGFGLWLTVWGTDALDGAVSFERNDPTGTTVTLEFPVVGDAA